MQLEATKAKADAGERAAEALQAKEAELEDKDNELKLHSDRVGDLSEKLKALKLERDAAMEKVDKFSVITSLPNGKI